MWPVVSFSLVLCISISFEITNRIRLILDGLYKTIFSQLLQVLNISRPFYSCAERLLYCSPTQSQEARLPWQFQDECTNTLSHTPAYRYTHRDKCLCTHPHMFTHIQMLFLSGVPSIASFIHMWHSGFPSSVLLLQ